jgi:hypothetical protein
MTSRLKTITFVAALSIAWVTSALAQFQAPGTVPKPTFGASITNYTTIAATPTDIFTITGSATKTVIVTFAGCSATSTAGGTMDFSLVKRTTLNTTGTSTVPATTKFDELSVAPTASLKAYSVNPGALGTSVGVAASQKLGFVPLASAGTPISWSMTDYPYTQPIILRGVNQTLAINGNGGAVPGTPSLNCSFNWIEF